METGGRDFGDAGGVNFAGEGLRRVALEEMARRRRRLGELTPAQERALESLLVSVADNISDLVSAAGTAAVGSRQQTAVGGIVGGGSTTDAS